MNRIRSATRKLRLALESLETRVTPAVINPIAAWAGGLRAPSPIVSNLDPNATPVGGVGDGSLTPNFPGGTTDPTTPGIPNTPNPNFPFRTTFLRFGPGGATTPGSGSPIPGGTITPPNVTVPNPNFNNSFLRTGNLTPNFPGGTTDPTTPGIPNTPNPNFPFRTTFLRSNFLGGGFGTPGTIGGGNVNFGGGGGTITTPGVNVPSTTFQFNNSFLRTGNPSTGVTTPGVTLPGTPIGTTPGSLGTPGLTFPGSL
ncbi:hypothetical protein [Planctomyces sp. SH-PL62]|uniref:hypothetical protein n=1 Tax=Planctomyces sp. SH-PL62 TaxID=1636152 RepID=UPI00078EF271|nr:hypothetical protein [Planctomyces sp. SH-PL62]AMV40579.1 hypothetical protein VT85_24325 [Planctomyces sp. SH-PL62]